MPYVDQTKVSYLRGSFACVHPIENYPNSDLALPNKLFESYHAEVPFVCSPLSAMSAFVAKERNGICAKVILQKILRRRSNLYWLILVI